MQILSLFEKVVAAEGEKKASLALKEASDIIDQSGCRSCYQLSTQQVMQYPFSSESYVYIENRKKYSLLRSALQLRYLQTLSTIAAEKNSTIVFPVPLDLLGAVSNATKK